MAGFARGRAAPGRRCVKRPWVGRCPRWGAPGACPRGLAHAACVCPCASTHASLDMASPQDLDSCARGGRASATVGTRSPGRRAGRPVRVRAGRWRDAPDRTTAPPRRSTRAAVRVSPKGRTLASREDSHMPSGPKRAQRSRRRYPRATLIPPTLGREAGVGAVGWGGGGGGAGAARGAGLRGSRRDRSRVAPSMGVARRGGHVAAGRSTCCVLPSRVATAKQVRSPPVGRSDGPLDGRAVGRSAGRANCRSVGRTDHPADGLFANPPRPANPAARAPRVARRVPDRLLGAGVPVVRGPHTGLRRTAAAPPDHGADSMCGSEVAQGRRRLGEGPGGMCVLATSQRWRHEGGAAVAPRSRAAPPRRGAAAPARWRGGAPVRAVSLDGAVTLFRHAAAVWTRAFLLDPAVFDAWRVAVAMCALAASMPSLLRGLVRFVRPPKDLIVGLIGIGPGDRRVDQGWAVTSVAHHA